MNRKSHPYFSVEEKGGQVCVWPLGSAISCYPPHLFTGDVNKSHNSTSTKANISWYRRYGTNTSLINSLLHVKMKRGFRAGNQFLYAEGCVLWIGLCDIRVGWSNSALKRRSYSNLMNLFWIPHLLNGKAFHRLEIERRTNSGSDARYSVLYLAFPALTCWTNHTPSSPLKPPQLWALDRF